MTELTLTIPMEPPSGNHYKGITKTGRVYVRSGAKVFHQAVAVIAAGRKVEGPAYTIGFRVFQGKGSRGDADNYSKVLFDALVKAGVISSDAKVFDYSGSKRRSWKNPRTEIVVRGNAVPKGED